MICIWHIFAQPLATSTASIYSDWYYHYNSCIPESAAFHHNAQKLAIKSNSLQIRGKTNSTANQRIVWVAPAASATTHALCHRSLYRSTQCHGSAVGSLHQEIKPIKTIARQPMPRQARRGSIQNNQQKLKDWERTYRFIWYWQIRSGTFCFTLFFHVLPMFRKSWLWLRPSPQDSLWHS